VGAFLTHFETMFIFAGLGYTAGIWKEGSPLGYRLFLQQGAGIRKKEEKTKHTARFTHFLNTLLQTK
jgi:hypothetical protein